MRLQIYWGVTLVQVIALLYKDQHIGTLQKLLNIWLETSLSVSSDDNESNTSPQRDGSDDSSPIITSDPTSDSSDSGGDKCTKSPAIERTRKTLITGIMRGKSTETETSTSSSGVSSMTHTVHSNESIDETDSNIQKKRDCPSMQSEDFGYVTQVENQESISTSSNEEDQPPVHQRPPIFQKSRYSTTKRTSTTLDKKELRRKKLVKRSKTHTISMKSLVHHLPTDDDISNILKEFTVDFLLKGYGTLVQDIYSQLLSNVHINIDTSHFFWLITYFLKFATQLELDLEHVSGVLSHQIMSFLVFQGVQIYEELEINLGVDNVDLQPCLRRLHLVVTAIREFLHAVETYQKMIHLSEDDRLALQDLQDRIVQMDDLRSLFLFLLRQHNSNLQSRQYLQDLILTNHSYLLFLDGATKEECSFNITDHLKQFATVEIMKQYGLLLENFKENGQFVNNCIFTMMHHIGGDLEHVATLFQPSILKTFSQIWETDYEICDDWSDLIEYIIHKFINSPRSNTELKEGLPTDQEINLIESLIQSLGKRKQSNKDFVCRWTEKEKSDLLGYYNKCRNKNDIIETITKQYQKSGMKHKTHLSIIQQLLEQNIINKTEYNDFMQVKQEILDKQNNNKDTSTYLVNVEEVSVDDNVRILCYYLCKENKGKFVLWLQNILIDTCYVKLALLNPDNFKISSAFNLPIIYHFSVLNLPIPVIPWTTDQNAILQYQLFVLLLHKLGLHLPIDTGKIFVTIPNFWNAEHVFNIAQKLGPIEVNKLKFDIAIFKSLGSSSTFTLQKEIANITSSFEHETFSMNETNYQPSTIVRFTPLPNSDDNNFKDRRNSCRLLTVDSGRMDCSPIIDDNELNSFETASIESDLTRMYVSDEEVLVSI